MSFNYDRIKQTQSNESSSWTSYSDLFMMLSVVFLLLYVTSSLRSGTSSLQSRLEHQRVVMENQDLKEQNKVYGALKDDYMAKQASTSEQQVYEDLMSKLSLLQDEAKQEKENLRAQAKDNEKKEMALNHYQQIVRNIINANVVAKARIASKDEVIEAKREEASELRKTIAEKEATISDNNKQIETINSQLDAQIKKLETAQKRQKTSKAKLEAQIAKLREQSEAKIEEIQQANQVVSQQLAAATGELESTKTALASTSQSLQQEQQEKQRLSEELTESRAQFEKEAERMRGDFDKSMAAKEKAFRSEMDKQKLSAAARAAKEAEFRAEAKKEADELAGKIAGLESAMEGKEKELKGKEKELAAAQAAAGEYKKYVDDLTRQKDGLAKDLQASKEQMQAKRALAKQISDNLKKAGVSASVDGKTGDVVLEFGEEYFDTGRSDLKPGMENLVRKFVPAYAQSLFKDKKVAEKIGSVEIIGFASPTFRGKYVDPQSLSEGDREAVTYNMDLSYQRANSIFKFMFDTDEITFNEQKRLLPLVKVTGRSYLHDGVKGRNLQSGVSVKEFCAKHDCKKEQRVIIKFDLKD